MQENKHRDSAESDLQHFVSMLFTYENVESLYCFGIDQGSGADPESSSYYLLVITGPGDPESGSLIIESMQDIILNAPVELLLIQDRNSVEKALSAGSPFIKLVLARGIEIFRKHD